MALENAYVTF